MVACKILWICLAVVAMNARLSQSQSDNQLKDCACFTRDKGGVRISNLADKHGKHERTVVYIFKHPDTRKVTIYVPSEENQIKFPDLTVSNLESYTDYTIENLYQIINNTKIPRLLLQIPDVHKHHKIFNQIHPHIINIKPDIKPNNKETKPVSPDLIYIEVDSQVNGPKEIDDKNILPQPQKPIINDHEPVNNVIESVYTVPGPKKHVHFTNDHVIQNHLTQVDVPVQINIENDQTQVNTINGQETKRPNNINMQQTTDEVNHLIINLSPIVETKPSRESITSVDNVMQEKNIYSVKLIEDMLNLTKNNVMPSAVILKQVNNPVFNRWLIEEISKVRSTKYDSIEIHRIKIRLLLILERSGLRFSENSDLIDMNGHVFKISNLKLRRVLIIDPVVYTKLEGKCVPHGIPYLEALFVSLVNPTTVLGVIPLKTTSLPRCKNSKCRKCAERKNTQFVVGPSLPHKLNLTPMHTNTKGLMGTMGSDSKNKDVSSTRVRTRLHDGHDRQDFVKTIHDHDNGDELGIRIIGGNPATSSGTPVSSRGRTRTIEFSSSAY